jgi:Ser/Thr protein kinase RdoA (MazF antagonist)
VSQGSTADHDRHFEAALSAWGAGFRIAAPLGGNRNDVRLVTHGRARFAARLSPRLLAALDWEVRLLDRLRRERLRVPATLPAADDRRIVDGLILFEWLDGEPPASPRDWAQVAQALRRLHALTVGWPQRPGFRSTRELLTEETGGDVRLDLMPATAVERCRDAWRPLADEPHAVVHGDPGAANIRISREGVGLIDWDEARVDAPILDLASLPEPVALDLSPERLTVARRALDAWEAATGWVVEPAYARRRLARLAARRAGPRKRSSAASVRVPSAGEACRAARHRV